MYRVSARVLHRFNLHHTQRHGPMEDGAYLHRCEWCGLHRKEVPMEITVQRMRAEREERHA
jgi:hypothetical protein